MKYSEQSE